jgi:RNA polymerase sigma factor (sigma-70 family)
VRQTVFFRLAQHLDRIRDPESVGSWIASVARNECLAIVRGAKANVGEDALASIAVAGPEAEVLAAERSSELWQAFAMLGDDCRTLLTLLLLEEPQPSYDEISIALDMPIGSIGPTRRRCLDRLKLALERT